MGFENINLWFAKDSDNKTILAKEITEEMRYNEYRCPICKSLVIPKLGQIMTSHFAHRDASKCSSETMVHFWVKNELIKIGDKFKVYIEGKITEYECKELKIEDEYKTSKGTYKPDLTVLTSTDEVIYIEIANTNKKKIKDYIGIWRELNNTVVEVEVKDISEGNKIDCIKAIYYDGKEYYEKLKELNEIANKEKTKYKFNKEQLDKIDWLINDICRYNNGLIEIDELSDEIQAIEDEDLRKLVVNIVRNKKCGSVMENYVEYNKRKIYNLDSEYVVTIKNLKVPNIIYDRVYGDYKISIKDKKNMEIVDLKLPIFKIIKYIDTIKYTRNLLSYLDVNNYIKLKYNKDKINPHIFIEYIHYEKNYNIEYEDFDNIENYIYTCIDDNYENLEKNWKENNENRRKLFMVYSEVLKNGYIAKIINPISFEVSKYYEDINQNINKIIYMKDIFNFNINYINTYFIDQYIDRKKDIIKYKINEETGETAIICWSGLQLIVNGAKKLIYNQTIYKHDVSNIVKDLKKFISINNDKFKIIDKYLLIWSKKYKIKVVSSNYYIKIYYKEYLIFNNDKTYLLNDFKNCKNKIMKKIKCIDQINGIAIILNNKYKLVDRNWTFDIRKYISGFNLKIIKNNMFILDLNIDNILVSDRKFNEKLEYISTRISDIIRNNIYNKIKINAER